jgi:hypothetical protein
MIGFAIATLHTNGVGVLGVIWLLAKGCRRPNRQLQDDGLTTIEGYTDDLGDDHPNLLFR